MEIGLDEFVARGSMQYEVRENAVFVRSGDVGSGSACDRGKGIPDSRLHYERLARQGIPMCPRAYDGCSGAMEVLNMNGVCSSGNYSSCQIFSARGGRR